MTKIEIIAAPTGADSRYQFFKDLDSGQEWKASVELRTARPAMLAKADIEAAPAELAVAVTVSPVDSNGKALRDANDLPIIIDSLAHTFTAVELAEPGFEPQARILNIIAERIDLGKNRLKGQDAIAAFVKDFEGKAKLKAGPVEFDPGTAQAGVIAPGAVEVVAVAGPDTL